ncbi:MAG: 6-phospho-beta-glucosidase [Verrucomicrobia bacterium]|nr:6-phospho-beta-glucosidase [Verrucomicrobiota bacterium]
MAVIGSGSSYTPMIVNEMAARLARLPVAELRLYDIDRRRQDIVAGFCERLAGDKLNITVPRRLRDAVDGADFVLSQFRVGGTHMRHKDIVLGTKYGLIGQETTGIGGFAKGLRTIPATLEICEAIRKYASKDAWLLNFTNPSGMITEAALKYGGVNSIGLCNAPYNLRRGMGKQLKADPKDVVVDYAGTNHFGWVRRVFLGGKDVSDRIRRAHVRYVAVNVPDPDRDTTFRRVMTLPYNSYLNYFYYTESMLHKIKKAKLSRAEEVAAIEKVLFRKYADPKTVGIPDDLKKRGGNSYNLVAADLVEAIARDLNEVLIVNVQNNGTIEHIEDAATVEVTCRISRKGAVPMFKGKLPPQCRGMLQAIKAFDELAVEAGVHGDLEAALHALIVHPLGPTAGYASRVLKDMLRINARYLPQFSQSSIRKFFKA